MTEKQHIHTSPWKECTIIESPLPQFMLSSKRMLNMSPSAPLIVDAVDKNQFVTPLSFKLGIIYLSNLLASAPYNLQHKDVVCILSPNSIHLPAIHQAILSTGSIVSPANVMYLPSELYHQLEKTQAKIVITTPANRKTVDEALAQGPNNVQHVLYVQDLQPPTNYTPPKGFNGTTNTIEFLPPVVKKLTPEDHAYYCFSSGTSGVPKGVVTTHQNVVANVQQQLIALGEIYKPSEVFTAFLPMSHIYGLSQFIYTLPFAGVKTIVFGAFNLEAVLSNIELHKISYMHIVPPVAVLLAKSPLISKYPDVKKHLKGVISGAAPLSKELAQQVVDRIGCYVWQAYGLTETSPITHAFSFDPRVYDISSIGWLVPGMEARIVDENGADVSEKHTRGELWLRGPNVMKGYLENPEATAAAFADEELTWFKTGDIVIYDETGQYHVVDRFKELIKSKGHQVAPAELEAILLTNDLVADAAVTGYLVPLEGTELPRAFVVLKEGVVSKENNKKTEKDVALEIKEWFDAKVARHKKLWGGIVVLDEIPKSASGKILRRKLRDRKDIGTHVYGYIEKSSKL